MENMEMKNKDTQQNTYQNNSAMQCAGTTHHQKYRANSLIANTKLMNTKFGP